jgi:isocitrate dehydrogenase
MASTTCPGGVAARVNGARTVAARPVAAPGARAAHRRAASVIAAASVTKKICVLPGDGIGPEISAVAVDVLKAAGAAEGVAFEFEEALIGGAAIDATGEPYPAATFEACKRSDAVLLAAIGG